MSFLQSRDRRARSADCAGGTCAFHCCVPSKITRRFTGAGPRCRAIADPVGTCLPKGILGPGCYSEEIMVEALAGWMMAGFACVGNTDFSRAS